MTNPATELRTAAQRLRDLATKATTGPWHTKWHGQQYELRGNDPTTYPITEWTYAIATWEPQASEQRAECDTADADWIAAMHPGVGTALADWLDTAADYYTPGPAHPSHLVDALAVARQINGGESR